ncbi:MAG: GAF domain-containing protein, partial [Acidobacteriota bacterium]
VWFRDEGNVVRDSDRKSALVQGVMMDITERKRAEILQNVLYRLAERTSPSQSMDDYYKSIHESLSELIYARNFYIALYDSENNSFSFPYSVSERAFSMDPQNAAAGLPGYVMDHGPLLADAEKLKELTAAGKVQDDGVPFVSWLGVPLKSNDRKLGILSVQCFSEDQKYVYGDLNSFLLLSAEVATTLEQKRAEKNLQDKSAQLQSINQAMTVFLETNDWKAASELILRSALRETSSEYGFIGVVSNGPVLRILAHEGLIWDQQINREFYENALRTHEQKGYLEFTNLNNLFGAVITQGTAVISNDPQNDTRAAHSLPAGHPPLNSFLGVPFYHGDQVIGLIGIANRPGGYRSADLEKVDFLSQTTVVLYHSYLQAQKQESLEQELRQSQKMEAVGRLAGGVAHDFNNLLMAITGYCELLLLKLRDDPLTREVKEILKSAGQGAALTRQLLAFGRRQVLMPRLLNMNQMVRDMEELLGRLIGDDIELTLICQPNLGMVRADPGQMEQVVMNLSLNARDAMPNGGKLFLETLEVNVLEPNSQLAFGIPPGSYVVLRVKDTGEGMDEATLTRIFEPFFTTKQSVGGSGLGLATVYGIVKQSNGHVNVQSELGAGTTFEIYLTKAEESAEVAAESLAENREMPCTILLVDDNEAVRKATSALLQARGFEVLEASNGLEAMTVSDKHNGPIHLLITDVVMPRMSGALLAEEIRQKRPNTKILFMSGFSEQIALGQNPGATFLQKPFSIGAFFGRINELLDLPSNSI